MHMFGSCLQTYEYFTSKYEYLAILFLKLKLPFNNTQASLCCIHHKQTLILSSVNSATHLGVDTCASIAVPNSAAMYALIEIFH